MRAPIVVDSGPACVTALRSNPGGICAVDAAGAANLPDGILAIVYTGD